MNHARNVLIVSTSLIVSLSGCGAFGGVTPSPAPNPAPTPNPGPTRSWLAGDSHVHSQYSPSYDTKTDPTNPNPPYTIGGDAIYPITKNAEMGRKYGLSWMLATDHGGPNHSKINMNLAYPELLQARVQVPEVLTFVGMEFNMPGMDHHTLMIPRGSGESQTLFDIESKWDKNEVYPVDPARDTEDKALQTINYIKGLSGTKPILMANHPARSATGLGVYGLDTPHELRANNDASPDIYVGFEGAPGHQAAALDKDGSLKAKPEGRGAYSNAPTYGGFDQMTARLGGLWDSLLGEGRRFWIVATSDSHRHYSDGGIDFWPGEFQKTYVKAEKTYDDIMDGLRKGRTFVTSGDLISELDLSVSAGGQRAELGGTLKLGGKKDVTVTLRLRDPSGNNFHGQNPAVNHVDLIVGQVTGAVASDQRDSDTNPTTRVEKTFKPSDWTREGEIITLTYTLPGVAANSYIRVRGASTDQIEPQVDTLGEDPWADLWFYSNPIFLEL